MATFEEVAAWLWRQTEPVPDWDPFGLGPPPAMGSSDRIRWAVVMAGADDRLRADLRPEAVRRRAARMAATMVDVLARRPAGSAGPAAGPVGTEMKRHGSMAERLASKLWSGPRRGPGAVGRRRPGV